jgi:hypothetical protein
MRSGPLNHYKRVNSHVIIETSFKTRAGRRFTEILMSYVDGDVMYLVGLDIRFLLEDP